MANITENIFDNREELISALTKVVADLLQEGINERDAASMLLSGGTTPGPLYEKLSRQCLKWEKVWFAPTDERWVAPDHDDSNEKLIRKTLITNNASSANYIGLKSMPSDPFSGEAETEEMIKKLPRPFDIVLLGMGDDGHTASLFPGLEDTVKALDEKNDNLCAGISRGGDDVDRMTMTLKCLLDAKEVFLFFYGQKKLAVFNEAKLGITPQYPVSYLLNQDKVPVTLYWAE